MTLAPGAIGSSDPPRLDLLFPGLELVPPISNDGTDIDIPVGIDFEFFMGDVVGVDFGVDCLGDFDPKFQNEWDFFDGDRAGEVVAEFDPPVLVSVLR
jgi:hypothetical protein